MYSVLTKLTKATTVEKCIGQRAQMILAASQGCSNLEIAETMPWKLERHCVGRWRKRWQDSFEALLAIEMNESPAAFERAIVDVLRDAHRSGASGKFTREPARTSPTTSNKRFKRIPVRTGSS